ncbi:MAG: glycosyltransferase [Sulfurimonas sp.]
MKICHFIASSVFGGAEKVVGNLCNEMSREHEVHFITFDTPEHMKHIAKNVQIHYFREFKRYNIFASWKLAKLINEISPDIIHTHGAKSTRIVYNIRHFIDAAFVGTKHNARRGKIFNRINHVIAVSKEAAKSIKSDHVKVIYNGIEPIEVAAYEKREDVFHILAVGRLDRIKAFDILIRECAKLTFPFLLQIVGEGSEREALERVIKSKKLEEKVELIGFQKDIPQRMHHADVVVMSSHSEGFSLVMVESLFYADIFLSTKVSGATEILSDRFLCTHDTLAEKLNDIHLHQKVYRDAFAQLKEKSKGQFLLHHVAKEHIEYYHEILEEKQ